MIGVDSNVLIRAFTADPPEEALRAAEILSVPEEKFINDVVIAEVAWVLARLYRFDRTRIAGVFRQLVAVSDVRFRDRDIVVAALDAYETGGAGLADHLIGAANAAAGCRTTLTFDKGAGKGPSFTDV